MEQGEPTCNIFLISNGRFLSYFGKLDLQLMTPYKSISVGKLFSFI